MAASAPPLGPFFLDTARSRTGKPLGLVDHRRRAATCRLAAAAFDQLPNCLGDVRHGSLLGPPDPGHCRRAYPPRWELGGCRAGRSGDCASCRDRRRCRSSTSPPTMIISATAGRTVARNRSWFRLASQCSPHERPDIIAIMMMRGPAICQLKIGSRLIVDRSRAERSSPPRGCR
jgi:hypothetical protein